VTRLAPLVRLLVKKLARLVRPQALVTRLVRPWQGRERSRVVSRRFITRVVVTQWRAFVAERRRGSLLLDRLLKELPEVFQMEVLRFLVGPSAVYELRTTRCIPFYG